MYRCMAVCCENEHYNMDDTQRCLDKCSGPARKAEQYISSELDRWQVTKFLQSYRVYRGRTVVLIYNNSFYRELCNNKLNDVATGRRIVDNIRRMAKLEHL